MRKNRNTPSRKIAEAIIAEYKPQTETADSRRNAGSVKGSVRTNMTGYLGYVSHDKGEKMTENRRNGYSPKTIKTSMGESEISIPRDRNASFESVILPKHKCDVSSIEGKVLAMYSRGMSQRDISATIDDIYGFKLSAEQISKITDCVLEEQRNWQNRPLKPFYPFIFVDCLYVNIRRDYESRDCAVYTILAYDTDGRKDWFQDTERKITKLSATT